MLKIVRRSQGQVVGPFAYSFVYRNDRGWHKPIGGRLISCINGYHLVRLNQLWRWLKDRRPRNNHVVYLVKADMTDALECPGENKVVVRNFRFICELECSSDFLGDFYNGGLGYWDWSYSDWKPTSAQLIGLAKRWGLDIKNWKIVGEYV
jgi:hypothetical protein